MSVTDVIDLGEPVVLDGQFHTSAGALYDPATVTLTITDPAGAVTTVGPSASPGYAGFTIVGTGRLSYTITSVGVAGVWEYTWTPAQGAIDTGHFLVGKAGATDGPCDDWCRPEDVFGCAPLTEVADGDKDYEEAARAVEIASRWLYLLSDRKYPGICKATVRPCRKTEAAWWYRDAWDLSGSWWNQSWGLCTCGATSGACGCGGISELLLSPTYRVLGLVSVYVDGQVLPASTYRVDDDVWLVRTDGGSWPSSQDLTADPHADPATFEVTFYYGAIPPPDAQRAARALAAQVYAACTGLNCALPANLRSRARAGDVIELAEVGEGFFGVQAADRFLEAERYGAANAHPVILSPQDAPTWRRAGT